jgi:hypothetical protein
VAPPYSIRQPWPIHIKLASRTSCGLNQVGLPHGCNKHEIEADGGAGVHLGRGWGDESERGNSELAFAKAQIEKETAEAPQDLPQRLISEDQYKRFAHRIDVAENQARAEKVGIWSDAMKEERESEGYR